ncbi:MAG: class I SAM-dependent methyltransferase [Alicyclobacillaceae bacterium]|nr:class I SAM-dependent methyltransferase [Alicyclobacillaceae bacterium]
MDKETCIADLERMRASGLFLDPLLARGIYLQLDDDCVQAVDRFVHRLELRHVRLDALGDHLGQLPYSPSIASRCLLEALVSTACQVAYHRSGQARPELEDIRVAHSRTAACLLEHGMACLYKLYFLIAGYDLLTPLHYHRPVSEDEFLQGAWHHPYPPDGLEQCLMIALAHGSVRYKASSTERFERTIQLTRIGQTRYEWMTEVLKESGYLEERLELSHTYLFDHALDLETLFHTLEPNSLRYYREFVDWMDISEGSQLLEVRCGTGTLTYDGELYRKVGEHGRICAVDESAGLLQQANRKIAAVDAAEHVQLFRASVLQLPFQEGVFDACLGVAVLQGEQPLSALAEMARVVMPGGTIGLLEALHVNAVTTAFQDWFGPLFDVLKRRNESYKMNILPTETQVFQWLHEVGLHHFETKRVMTTWVYESAEEVVQLALRAIPYLQREFLRLPWDDRRSIALELIDRGRDVCRRCSLAERTLTIPMLFIKARRPVGRWDARRRGGAEE